MGVFLNGIRLGKCYFFEVFFYCFVVIVKDFGVSFVIYFLFLVEVIICCLEGIMELDVNYVELVFWCFVMFCILLWWLGKVIMLYILECMWYIRNYLK